MSRLRRPPRLPRLPPVRRFTVLGIETSCDDTSLALLRTATPPSQPASPTRAHLVYHRTITSPNKRYGGVHPFVSLSSHRRHLAPLVASMLATRPESRPDLVAVTRGPGMVASLAAGLDLAKGLAVAWDVPIVGVHHMQAHALTPRMVAALDRGEGAVEATEQRAGDETPEFPFLTLLVSGGHTLLLHSAGLCEHRVLASTMDIAIGDMLDKVARALLPPSSLFDQGESVSYGQLLEEFCFPSPPSSSPSSLSPPEAEDGYAYHPPDTPQRAAEDAAKTWKMAPPLTSKIKEHHRMAYSFSGLETSAERALPSSFPSESDELELRRRIGRDAMTLAFEHLASRVVRALDDTAASRSPASSIPKTLVMSGGVASNRFLRHLMPRYLDHHGYGGLRMVTPPVAFCTDNAAMVAWTGWEMFRAGWESELGIEPVRKWSLDSGDGVDKEEGEQSEGEGGENGVGRSGHGNGNGNGEKEGTPAGVLGIAGWRRVRGR